MGLTTIDLSAARWQMLKERPRPRASFTDAGRWNRATADWVYRILSSNQVVGMDQDRIVSRSRELALDDTTMAKFLATVWKNVFGPDGIRLQSRVLLQRGGRPNIVVNRIIEGAWAEWGKKQNCTLDKRLSWLQLQKLVSRTVVVDGECFLRKVKTSANPFGFCLQVINTDRVDRTWGRNAPLILPNGNIVFMGIESSGETGEVAAYHIFNRHPSEFGSGPRERIRVPAEEIIHIFLPTFDNQWRGLPWATPAMYRMHQLSEYMKSELVASRVGASMMGFVTKTADPDAPYPSNQEPEGVDYMGGGDLNLEPGAFNYLSPGEQVQTFSPNHPTTSFPPFVKESKLDIACGLDAAYMTLSGDIGSANYSSSRTALLDERATWEGIQGFYVEELCNQVFEPWLQMTFLTFLRSALAGGNVDDYMAPEWHPRKFPWIDPLKDMDAIKAQLSAGQTTLTRELASQGYGFEETIDELVREVDYLKAKGLEWMLPLIFGGPNARVSETGTAEGAQPAAPARAALEIGSKPNGKTSWHFPSESSTPQ